MSDHCIRLAITPGEPAGIGPDLALQLATETSLFESQPFELVAIADRELLQQRADLLGLNIKLLEFDANRPPQPQQAGQLLVQQVDLQQPAVAGQLNPANAHYVLETLKQAVSGCQQSIFDALVTGPVHKGIINDAGIAFTGHTEFLAEQLGGCTPVMMLAHEGMRVALATTHLPLVRVSEAITRDSLREVIEILHRDLRQRFALASPAIYVCGLNPHAGEDGHLGREEIDTIQPVIDELNATGMNLHGAMPADTVFTSRYLEKADAILAMYHDQGLPVLKHSGFGQAVNITLGLPIIRTSVDHGTALDLAGTGQAEVGSFIYACQVACRMALAAATSA